jgi:hypothetical protein
MEPKMSGFITFGSKSFVHYFGVDATGSSKFGHLLKEFHSAAEKKR